MKYILGLDEVCKYFKICTIENVYNIFSYLFDKVFGTIFLQNCKSAVPPASNFQEGGSSEMPDDS